MSKKSRAEKLADATIAAHAPAEVRPTTDSERPGVTFNVTLPAVIEVPMGESTFRITTDGLTQHAVEHMLDYGIGRFARDGTTRIAVTDAEGNPVKKDGKIEMRDATDAERIALAEAKLLRLLEGKLRERTATADPLTGAARLFTIKALRARGVVPKAIPKLGDRATMEAVLAAYPGLWAKVLALAENHVKVMAEAEAGLSLD